MNDDPYREIGMDSPYRRSPDWQQVANELGTSDKEKLAIWMIDNGFATGHGDSIDDLLRELSWQVKELTDQLWSYRKDKASS